MNYKQYIESQNKEISIWFNDTEVEFELSFVIR